MGLETQVKFLLLGSVVAACAQLSFLMTSKEEHTLKYIVGALMGAFLAHLSFTGIVSSLWKSLPPLLLIVLGGPIGFKGAAVLGLLFDDVWGAWRNRAKSS